jgi:V8-like Glu-specific endopeptidase
MSFREVTAAERLKIPYSAVGVIFATFPDGSSGWRGSAAVIGLNDIVTATHVIYDPGKGGFATKIEFYFGADYNSTGGYFENYGYRLTSDFRWEIKINGTIYQDGDNSTLTSAESQYDIAIIGVSVEIGKQTGWLGIDWGRDYSQTVIAAGYPGNNPGMMTETITVDSNPRWGVYNGISQMGGGSSGGPLFTNDNYIIGVRSSGSGPGTKGTWADIGFAWHWIEPFLKFNDYLLTSSVKPVTPTYNLVSQATTVNEGGTAVFTLSTTNVAALSILTYTLSGVQADDIVSGRLTGTVEVGADGKATISIPIKKDLTTEGDETLRVIVESAAAIITVKDTSRVLDYPAGDKYVGDVINGIRQGQGTYTFANGNKYVGDFNAGNFEGLGTYTFANGNKYVGDFKASKFEGQGTYTFTNGNKYVGDFKAGNFEGLGTYTFANGNKYVGAFKADKFEGQGTFTFANGNKYVGSFKNDLREGLGTFTFVSGDKYVGDFRANKFEGQGTYTFANGNKYVGLFKNDLREGQGTYTFANGDKYIGSLLADKFEGQGTLTYANGDTYVGAFKADKFEGQGTFTFANGRVSKGEFKNDGLVASKYEIEAASKSVFEGETADFTLTVTNYRSGDILSFSVSGIQSEDVVGGKLSGFVFVGIDGKAKIPIPITEDNVREGHEKMTLTVQGKSATVTINDTIKGNSNSSTNTVEYPNLSSNYAVSRKGSGEIEIIFHSGAKERLIGIDQVKFADKTVNSKDVSYIGTYTDVSETNFQAAHRFYNTRDKAYFYTGDPNEKNSVLLSSTPNASGLADTSWPYVYQGSTFEKAHTYNGGTPLFRFYNTETGHHFFTASKDEADYVKGKSDSGQWPFKYEGVAFNVYASDPTPNTQGQEVAVHRFYSPELNRHFYTANQTEVDEIKLTGQWKYEGIGFWGEII